MSRRYPVNRVGIRIAEPRKGLPETTAYLVDWRSNRWAIVQSRFKKVMY